MEQNIHIGFLKDHNNDLNLKNKFYLLFYRQFHKR